MMNQQEQEQSNGNVPSLLMPPVDDDDLDATPKTVNNKKAMEDRDEALSVKPKVEGGRKVAFGAPEDNQVHVYEQEVKPTRAGTRMNRINALHFVNVDGSDSNSDDGDGEIPVPGGDSFIVDAKC
jgi:hypothetical protein